MVSALREPQASSLASRMTMSVYRAYQDVSDHADEKAPLTVGYALQLPLVSHFLWEQPLT